MSGKQTGRAVSLITKVNISQYWHELQNPAAVVLRSHWPGLLYKRSSLFLLCHTMLLLADAKLLQLCSTLCNPIDSSPPGSPIPGILQARTLEWVAISFSNAWKWKVKVKSLSHVQLFATPWTAAHQAPPSMGFSRQEYWSGLPMPSSLLSASKPMVQAEGEKKTQKVSLS